MLDLILLPTPSSLVPENRSIINKWALEIVWAMTFIMPPMAAAVPDAAFEVAVGTAARTCVVLYYYFYSY